MSAIVGTMTELASQQDDMNGQRTEIQAICVLVADKSLRLGRVMSVSDGLADGKRRISTS